MFPQLFCIIPDGFIQNLLMNPVRTAIAFPVPMISSANVLHTAASVPVTDHGAEHVPTFLTGQQPSITVLYTVVDRRTRLLLQPSFNCILQRLIWCVRKPANPCCSRKTDYHASVNHGESFFAQFLQQLPSSSLRLPSRPIFSPPSVQVMVTSLLGASRRASSGAS